MIKQFLLGSALFTVAVAGLATSAEAGDRSNAAPAARPAQAAPAAPAARPAQPAPAAPGSAAPATPAAAAPSSSELDKFASAIKELRDIQTAAQSQAAQVIESTGLTTERFGQILQSQQPAQPGQPGQAAPAARPQPEVSAQDRQRFQQAITQIDSIRTETQKKMETAVAQQGLQIDRFNQIMTIARQDPQVRQQIQQRLQ